MASTEEILHSFAEICNDVAGTKVEDVQMDKSFTDDLDVDSLEMVEIIYAAEDKFGVSIPEEESKNLKTVGDAVAYIQQHQDGAAAGDLNSTPGTAAPEADVTE